MIAYTSITNGKDKERDDILNLSSYDKFRSPVMNAKIYKVLPHKFLDTDISIWMDGNIYPLKPLEWYVKEWLGDADMAFLRHYKSKNLDWELKWIKYKFNRRSEVYLDAKEQVEHYKKLGEPKKLAMGGFIIRRHTEEVAKFNEAWWAEICRWGQRDQLSLPVVLEKSAAKINIINENIKTCSQLRYEDHAHYET